MKKQNKIYQHELIRRLAQALRYPVGANHFAVLMHGWMKKHPYSAPTTNTLWERRHRDGELWLYDNEVASLSGYAGYDLTQD